MESLLGKSEIRISKFETEPNVQFEGELASLNVIPSAVEESQAENSEIRIYCGATFTAFRGCRGRRCTCPGTGSDWPFRMSLARLASRRLRDADSEFPRSNFAWMGASRIF